MTLAAPFSSPMNAGRQAAFGPVLASSRLRVRQMGPDDVARIMQAAMKRTRGLTLTLEDVRRDVYLVRYDRLRVSDADIQDTEAIARVFLEEGKTRALGDIRAVVDNRFAEQAQDLR